MSKTLAVLFAASVGVVTWGVTHRPAPVEAREAAVAPMAAAAVPTARPASLARAATLPAGTSLTVRLDQTLSTKSNQPGDRFSGTLSAPVTVDGRTLLPAGTSVNGVVRDAAPSGRLAGQAVLRVALTSVEIDGREVPISTSARSRVSGGHKKRNWAWIGGTSGAGAVIGAIAGGGKGAAIGAASGAAAGTAGAAATGKLHVSMPAETVLSFQLQQAVAVPVRS
ncbi:MAG: hypothetical protein SFV18_12045 [Bryobacteraceae bacterium]|nr:hypothetical protein [Bryobacteraceae bacterium]